MANNTGWIAGRGVGFTWTTTNVSLVSLAANACAFGTAAIVNTTALDLYADVSFTCLNGGTATVAGAYLSLYVLSLNQDGTTYGDNSSVATVSVPNAQYLASSVGLKPGVAATTGVLTGTFRGVILPPRNFLFAIANNSTALGTTSTVNYVTYNESLNS